MAERPDDELTALYLRLYFDEDVSGAIVKNLRNRGFDVVSVPEVDRLGRTDEAQMRFAVSQRRTVFTHNLVHFEELHRQMIERGEHHFGVIVAKRRPSDEIVVRKLLELLDSETADEMRDQLRYL